MTAPDLSPEQAARVAADENAPAAEEALRERVADVLLMEILGTTDRDFLSGCELPADEIARLIVEYAADAAIELGAGYYQYTVGTDDAQEMADALLPVVEAECRRRAAEAIEPFVALADEMERQITFRRETNENDPVAEVRETDLRWLRLAIQNARQS